MVHKLSSFVVVFILFAASSYAIPVGEVNNICKQTDNPSFCFALLNSKPNSDLISLTQYIIDVARVNITNTIKLINSLIAQSASDPNAKSHYTECLVHIGSNGGALNHIDYTQEMLEKRDYQGVNVAAAAVIADIDDCISGESPSDPPYQDSSMLPKYAHTIDLVVQIIVVISNNWVFS